MATLSYTHTRNNLAKVFEQAEENREPIMVTRSGKKPTVILSIEEFESMQETLHLMSSPKNLARMLQGLEDYKEKKFISQPLNENQ